MHAGIETLGGLFNVIIPRNTSVPTRFDHVFTTGVDNQTMVEIKIFQGERPLANVRAGPHAGVQAGSSTALC